MVDPLDERWVVKEDTEGNLLVLSTSGALITRLPVFVDTDNIAARIVLDHNTRLDVLAKLAEMEQRMADAWGSAPAVPWDTTAQHSTGP